MSGTATVLSSYSYPTAISWGYPHLEVFAVGPGDASVYRKYRGLDSSDLIWKPTNGSLDWVGGTLTSFDKSVAAVSRTKYVMDIYVTGGQSDGTFGIWERSHGQGACCWANWGWLGGEAITAPAVVSRTASKMDVFVLKNTFELYQISWDPTTFQSPFWGSWSRLGGNWSVFAPTVVSWDQNRMDVFVVDSNSLHLYHTYWNGSWQPSYGFESLGGYCTSRPTAVSWGSGRLDIFVRGGDAGLWHLSYNGSWSNWTSISGNTSVQAEPEAISWGANRIDVFAWGTDNSLLHKSLDGTKGLWTPSNGLWTPSNGFEVLGDSLAGPPKGVSDAVGSLHVVSFSRFGSVQHISFNQTLGTWSPEGSVDNLGTPVGGGTEVLNGPQSTTTGSIVTIGHATIF